LQNGLKRDGQHAFQHRLAQIRLTMAPETPASHRATTAVQPFSAYHGEMRLPLAVVAAAIAGAAPAAERTTFLVQVDPQATWRDLAYIAAVPASEEVNRGGASLIASDASAGLAPSLQNYLRRYRPDAMVIVGAMPSGITTKRPRQFAPSDAEHAARQLSQFAWRRSGYAVICRSTDYASALIAAPVAARLSAPLLFSRPDGRLSAETQRELARLGARQSIWVGTPPLRAASEATFLADANAVIAWFRRRSESVPYIAAVNPTDRDRYTIRKLSLLGAQLAAGRRGLVVPLNYKVMWKQPMASTVSETPVPAEIPAGNAPAKRGVTAIDGENLPFILTGDREETNLRLFVQRTMGGAWSGPYASGDLVTVQGKPWVVSLGTRTKFGESDVHLTWPTAEVLASDLDRAYTALGRVPAHLCVVGFPDVLPHGIIGGGGIVEEQVSDLAYAAPHANGFPRIGVGRIIAEGIGFGSVWAARSLTYNELQRDPWAARASQSEWENSLGPLFANVGFSDPYYAGPSETPWKVSPAEGREGQRAASFSAQSPLATSAILAHSEHSWWRSLGSMFTWDADTEMAPTVVESGGCGTACLDRDAGNRSVVARLLRVGAVSFAGGSRELSAQAQVMRTAYWNGVLAGKSLGEAHREAQITGLMTSKDLGEDRHGAYRYNMNVRMLFGDPALVVHLPSAPRTAPARTVLRGTTVTVHAPAKWWTVKTVVPPDWKQWAGKDLYAVRGAGAYALSSWGPDGHDVETVMVNAEFTTARPVQAIRQVSQTTQPLGWREKWHSVRNENGSYTTRFAVQMVDFDAPAGRIIRQVDRLEYALSF
jgi:hypothetical protein